MSKIRVGFLDTRDGALQHGRVSDAASAAAWCAEWRRGYSARFNAWVSVENGWPA